MRRVGTKNKEKIVKCIICDKDVIAKIISRKYCDDCYRKLINNYNKIYQEKNREKLRADKKEYYRKNKEIIRIKQKECNKKYEQKRKTYRLKYYQDRREKLSFKQKKYRQNNKVRVIKYLGSKCLYCGIEYDGKNAAIFYFHHRDGKEKKYEVSHRCNMLWTSLISEINKCDLLCANCHSLRHSEKY